MRERELLTEAMELVGTIYDEKHPKYGPWLIKVKEYLNKLEEEISRTRSIEKSLSSIAYALKEHLLLSQGNHITNNIYEDLNKVIDKGFDAKSS